MSDSAALARGRQRAFGCAGVMILCALLVVACHGGHHGMRRHARHHGYAGDAGPVQVISALVGGKNVFIPSTIVVTSGEGRTLSVFNTTDAPHGFSIPALGISEVLPPGEEHVIALPALERRQVLQINCHLHPPHRSATLVVLPARDPQK